MTKAEERRKMLSSSNINANSSITTSVNKAQERRKLLNATTTKTTQPANMPSYEEHLKTLEEKKQRNTESLISSLPVSATAVKTQIQNNDNNFKTGINPDFQNAKAETQKKAYEQIKNSGLTNNIKEYATAKNYYEETLPTEEKDNYLNYKALAERTDNPTEKAKYNVMAEKSKKHSDLYYVPAQTAKTLATSVADSAVNAVQFAKNAFKSEMEFIKRNIKKHVHTMCTSIIQRTCTAILTYTSNGNFI